MKDSDKLWPIVSWILIGLVVLTVVFCFSFAMFESAKKKERKFSVNIYGKPSISASQSGGTEISIDFLVYSFSQEFVTIKTIEILKPKYKKSPNDNKIMSFVHGKKGRPDALCHKLTLNVLLEEDIISVLLKKGIVFRFFDPQDNYVDYKIPLLSVI
jgi:hypothetical protein